MITGEIGRIDALLTAPSGMMFSKWDKGKVGKKITITEDTVITAQWKKIPVKRDYTLLAKLLVDEEDPTKLNLTWTSGGGAEGYDVYFGECGSEMKKVSSVEERNYTLENLSLKTNYKAKVRVYKYVEGKDGKKKKTYIRESSPVVHAIVGGSDEAKANPKSVTVKQEKVELKLGKTHTIEAKVTGVKSGKKITVLNHGGLLRYFSSNSNIATVDANGKITPKAAGGCTIYVMASNGIREKIELTVTH